MRYIFVVFFSVKIRTEKKNVRPNGDDSRWPHVGLIVDDQIFARLCVWNSRIQAIFFSGKNENVCKDGKRWAPCTYLLRTFVFHYLRF